MKSLKSSMPAEVADSNLLATHLLQEFEHLETLEEPEQFELEDLKEINLKCFKSTRAAQNFSKKMIKMMEQENYEFEDCSPVIEDGSDIPNIIIPIKSFFDELSDFVCTAMAS